MYRFQTRICYKCIPLEEIYDLIDTQGQNATVTVRNHTQQFDDLCLDQLQNHEVRNLLTTTNWRTKHPYDDEETQNAMIEEAIRNMKKYFTVIGLTEEMQTTAQILGTVFPWLNETIPGTTKACPVPHDNKSPANNMCVENGRGKPRTHWALPDQPDEETRRKILQHNQMDLKLYEAAVSYFELQKRAFEGGEVEG
jgi:hypothetical protein